MVLSHTVFYSLFAQNSLALFFSRIFSNIAIKVIMYLNPKFSLGLFEARMWDNLEMVQIKQVLSNFRGKGPGGPSGPRNDKAKLDKEWNKISSIIDKRKSGGGGGGSSKKPKYD